jgi:hypothetical protein
MAWGAALFASASVIIPLIGDTESRMTAVYDAYVVATIGLPLFIICIVIALFAVFHRKRA